MPTIDEEITDQQEWLTLLKATRKDMAESGLTKRIGKGTFSATFHSIEEIELEIRRVKNSLIMLQRSVY